ncbi:MAG: hypothetical protein M3M98_01350, partial [Nitrospirota bacterium]|nr:hypothetical protein [Nitrospirota bacterium]
MDGNSIFSASRKLATFGTVLTIWLGLGVPSPSHGAGAWTNEPSGFSVLVDCPFSNSLCPGMYDVYNTASFSTDSGAPLSPNTVLNDYIAAGSSTGNGQWGANLPDARELYIGAWWSTNSDFQGICNNTNKVLFARSPSMDNNFLVWQGSPGAQKTLKWYM